MTKLDFDNVIGVIEELKKMEKEYCEGYVKLNPDDRKWRESVMAHIINGMDKVEYTISHLYRNILE